MCIIRQMAVWTFCYYSYPYIQETIYDILCKLYANDHRSIPLIGRKFVMRFLI